jgi:hypothetical protein
LVDDIVMGIVLSGTILPVLAIPGSRAMTNKASS